MLNKQVSENLKAKTGYDLKRDIEVLWQERAKNSSNDNEKNYMEKYIKNLLNYELKYIKEKNRNDGLTCDTLVYLVGFALEPLLLSICIKKPTTLILILNKKYGGETGHVRYKEICALIDLLKEKISIDVKIESIVLDNDTPSEVFKCIEKLCNDKEPDKCKDLTIDITGGKKSMMAGSFLYAAYKNFKISYVDFEEYSAKYQRPYGHTCKLSILENPYEKFALRDWEQLKNLYNKYHFSAAKEFLLKIEGVIKPIENKESFDKLSQILDIYRYWDESRYKEAKEAKELLEKLDSTITLKFPIIIEMFQDTRINSSINIFNESTNKINDIKTKAINETNDKPELAYVYAMDEINKAKRLIMYEDYRSAIIKCATACELLINCSVYKLIDSEKEIVMKSNMWKKRNLLKCQCVKFNDKTTLKLNSKDISNYTKFNEFSNKLDDMGKLAEVRNSIAHGCIYLTEDEAQEAIKISEGSAKRFKEWLKLSLEDEIYEVEKWEEIKKVCKLEIVEG